MDWVLPTDEILARVEKLVEEERKASALKPAAVTIGNDKAVPSHKPHNDFMSRLFKFALPFKRNAYNCPSNPCGLEPPGASAG
jgi:hypothetical protein